MGPTTFLRKIKVSATISLRVAIRRLSDSPLLQPSGNSYFLSDEMDTLQEEENGVRNRIAARLL
jgi:hypothetical protein